MGKTDKEEKKWRRKVKNGSSKWVQFQRLCMWKEFLENPKNVIWVAPPSFFKYAPFSSNWKNFAVPKMMIELPNPLVNPDDGVQPVNWISTIGGYAGYKAWVVSEPMASTNNEQRKSVSTWIPFCSSIPKTLGYSFTQNNVLHPPTETVMETEQIAATVQAMYREILFKESKSAEPETIRVNHHDLVLKELEKCSSRFSLGEVVEAMNKNDCSGYRLGEVVSMVGDRVLVVYMDDEDKHDEDDFGEFWFNQHSNHIHKLGWCKAVGAPLQNVKLGKMIFPEVSQHDDGLNLYPVPPGLKIADQMIFEIRHPVLTHKITAGYVVKVLKNGYFIAATDWTKKSELVEIVMHVTSDYILPLGFCNRNNIPFEPPTSKLAGNNDSVTTDEGKVDEYTTAIDGKSEATTDFSWETFRRMHDLIKFDPTSVRKGPNKFVKGCKLEAIDIASPLHLKPATVTKVAERLLKIHFDGKDRKDRSSFQWVSCESSNIYPLGYGEMVSHNYQGRPEETKFIDHLGS